MNVLVKAGTVAAAGLAVLVTAGCAASGPGQSRGPGESRGPGQARGSVQACIAFGVRAIEDHRTVTQVPAACGGLSRADINFALGRSIYLVAASGHHKVAWRRDAAVAGARLARLITTAMASGAPGAPSASAGPGGRPGPVDRRPLGLATLAAWLLTVGSGGYMLLRFVLGGGLRRPRAAGDRTGPAVVLTHFGLASSGLLLWAVYLATSRLAVAWAAVGLLLPVIGFGMATLIVWTTGSSRSRASASGRTHGTSGAPSGTSGARPGTPDARSGTPGASGEPTSASAEPSLPGAGPSPAGAPGPVSPAGARVQVQVAEVPDHEPGGQASPARQAAPGRHPSRWLTVIIPIIHGLLASTTILLALLTALGAT